MDGISIHKFREKWNEKFPRGGEWNVTSNLHTCSKNLLIREHVAWKNKTVNLHIDI